MVALSDYQYDAEVGIWGVLLCSGEQLCMSTVYRHRIYTDTDVITEICFVYAIWTATMFCGLVEILWLFRSILSGTFCVQVTEAHSVSSFASQTGQ